MTTKQLYYFTLIVSLGSVAAIIALAFGHRFIGTVILVAAILYYATVGVYLYCNKRL